MSTLGQVLNDFGTDKLGYQDQLAQANASLDEVIRNRALKQKQAQEASYKNAEIALKNQQMQRQLEKDAEEKAHYNQHMGIEGTAAVLERVRSGDTEGARAIGAPYGMTFEPDAPAAPQADTRALPPEARAMAARNQPPASAEVPPEVADIMAPLPEIPIHGTGDAQEPVEGPRTVFNADTGQASVRRLSPSTQGSMEMAPQEPASAPGAGPSPPAQAEPKKFTFHTPGGQTVSVDPEQQRTGDRSRYAKEFLDAHLAEADSLFQSASGKPPEVAARIRAEATQQRADAKRIAAHIASGAVEPKNAGSEEELGVRQRQGQAITEKDRYLEAGRNDRAAQAAAAAAAGRRGDQPPGAVDPKVYARYQADVAEVKKNSLATKDLQQLRNVRQSLAETKNPNGPQMQIALDTIVKEAAGGRLSVQLEQNARNAMGGITSAENWAYRQTHNGENMPKYVNAYRKIIKDAKAELDRQLMSDAAAFEHKAGIKSHHYQNPQLRPYVLDNRRAYYEALGLPVPSDPTEATPTPTEDDNGNEAFINGH